MTFYGKPKEVVIRFVSNGRISSRGFRTSYTQLQCDDFQIDSHKEYITKNKPLNTFGVGSPNYFPIKVFDKISVQDSTSRIPCDLVIYDEKFEITSPNFPNSYPINSDCLYSIRKSNPRICKLKLHLLYFNVDKMSFNCQGDYLEINKKRICGELKNSTISNWIIC